MTTKYSIARYRAEARREPFAVELDSGDTLAILPPKSASVLELDPSLSTAEVLKRLAGDSYQALVDAVGDEDASVLVAVMKDMQKHFGLGG
ncbi:hypothetical protein [Actinomadura rudentiformis]|uniref:Uncharacterized protein n=1 Tax=Actinomadura rudentiformis TaxID=359158 RepID=A0A6H9YXH7_9ACTN|nr:hypothetical protein [Actinomadura rudentiformis]KAB2344882.1 hypothetical protein F8566_30295 [Actinomadura rudentiformis]